MHALSSLAMTVTMWLYVAIAVYIVGTHWQTHNQRSQIRLAWLLGLPPLVFAAMWFSGRGVWELFWYGIFAEGNGPSRAALARPASVIAALMASLLLYIRLINGYANKRFLRVTLYCAITLPLFFSVALASEFASHIMGWSARGAAEGTLAGAERRAALFIDPNTSLRIVEEELPPEFRHAERQPRRFVLYSGPAPIREVYVSQYGLWWWTAGSSKDLYPGVSALNQAPERWSLERERTRAMLESIIRDYSNSEASRRAEALLKELQSRPGTDE